MITAINHRMVESPLRIPRRIGKVLLILTLTLLSSLTSSSPAFGATLVVDRTDDDPAFAACTASPNDCTLRGAIIKANADAIADTINLPAGTYTLTNAGSPEDWAEYGDLDIIEDLTIQGDGQNSTIIDGNGAVLGERVFDILGSTTTVILEDLTIQSAAHSGSGDGGGIQSAGILYLRTSSVKDNTTTGNGGGVHSSGDLFLNGAVISGNSSTVSGGGINFIGGQLTVTASMITNNQTSSIPSGGGGIHFDGTGDLTITSTSIINNSSYQGGGVTVFNAMSTTGTLTDLIINANSADYLAGGILWASSGTGTITQSNLAFNQAPTAGGLYSSGGTVVVLQSSIHNNLANDLAGSGDGGGVYNIFNLSMENTTVSGNSAYDNGGGIWNADNAQLVNVTVAENTADADGNATGSGGGIYAAFSTTNTINSIYAGNQSQQCDTGSGIIASNGYNLSSDGSCGFSSAGDRENTPAGIAGLGDYGGSTLTHALLPGSPALHNAYLGACTGEDQRGVSRPQGPGCDIGAFEQDLLLNLFLPVILN